MATDQMTIEDRIEAEAVTWRPAPCDCRAYPKVFARIPGLAEAESELLNRGGQALMERMPATGREYPYLSVLPEVAQADFMSRASMLAVDCVDHMLGHGMMHRGVQRIASAALAELQQIRQAVEALAIRGPEAGTSRRALQSIEQVVLQRQFRRHDALWRWLRSQHVVIVCERLLAAGIDTPAIRQGIAEYSADAERAWDRYVNSVPVVTQVPEEVTLAAPVMLGCNHIRLWARPTDAGWRINDVWDQIVYEGDEHGACEFVRRHEASAGLILNGAD